MDISGSYTLKAPRERVWECLLDPDMLQRTIPGCEKLEQTGPDEWRMRVNIGIAAVKGVYEGTLRMTDRVPPEQYRMVADGTGARSVLHGEGTLTLEAPDPHTTVVNYQGQAQIVGPLAGIANRVAPSVSKMLLKQFFGRFQQEMDATGASALVADDAPGAEGAGDASDSVATADAPEAAGDASASAAPSAAPQATTTMPQEPDIIDASTSGVWEMSLPEARPLDDGQVLASALPLDSVPASRAASTASVAPAAPTAATELPAPAAASASGAAPSGDGVVSPVSAAPDAGEPSIEDMSGDGASPAAATITTPATAEDMIFDASTSGVWEMSLPEARSLEDEQTLATALPLDTPPAVPAATNAPTVPTATAATATADASSTPSAAPALASSVTSEPAAPAHAASVTPAPAQPVASASASATMPAGPRASSGGFMAWLMRLFGRAG